MCLGIPSRVVSLEKNPLGMTVGDVEAGGVVRRIRLDYLPDAEVGDYVMVQMGFAVSRISEAEAGDVLDALGQLVDLSPLDHDSLPTGTGAFTSVQPPDRQIPRRMRASLFTLPAGGSPGSSDSGGEGERNPLSANGNASPSCVAAYRLRRSVGSSSGTASLRVLPEGGQRAATPQPSQEEP